MIVRFMGLPFAYIGCRRKHTRYTKGGIFMSEQIRYVGGHVEVYSAAGEFLFSADTVAEAWRELDAA